MSKLVGVAVGRSDLLNTVASLSLRSGNRTGSGEGSIATVIFTSDLKWELLAIYNKVEIWQILARILAIKSLHVSKRRCCKAVRRWLSWVCLTDYMKEEDKKRVWEDLEKEGIDFIKKKLGSDVFLYYIYYYYKFYSKLYVLSISLLYCYYKINIL